MTNPTKTIDNRPRPEPTGQARWALTYYAVEELAKFLTTNTFDNMARSLGGRGSEWQHEIGNLYEIRSKRA